MSGVRPKSFDFKALTLTAEEGFVLSRIDGPTSVRELSNLTALDETRVAEIVAKLASQGAVDVEGGAAAPTTAATPAQAPEEEAAPEPTEASTDDEDAPTPEEAQDAAALDEEEARAVTNERMYLEVYAKKFKSLSVDQRVAAALTATGSDLMALCLDPDPQVVHAIVQNPMSSVEHARALAFHHRTHVGLEMVAKRADHLVDSLVQRRLLRNPQIPGSILVRIMARKVLIEVYKSAIDREIPDRTRQLVRVELRKRFMAAGPDERAALLVKTEARVLVLLVDCALDARTTQLLVGKTGYSILFVQNVARWSASPPPLLVHLLKQQTVRRNPGIRKMLLRHPNMPSEAKKQFA